MHCEEEPDRHDDSCTSQDEHVAQAVPPGELNCPAGHAVQMDAPAAAAKLPAGHITHAAPAVL